VRRVWSECVKINSYFFKDIVNIKVFSFLIAPIVLNADFALEKTFFDILKKMI
jgi:hypothetical protein